MHILYLYLVKIDKPLTERHFYALQVQKWCHLSITRFLLSFFFEGQKVKYLSHLQIYHPNFSVNLPMVFIYKFCKKEILIQPPGEPRKHKLGEV